MGCAGHDEIQAVLARRDVGVWWAVEGSVPLPRRTLSPFPPPTMRTHVPLASPHPTQLWP